MHPGVKKLYTILVQKGIYRPKEAVDIKDEVPFNHKLYKIKDVELRAAMREKRFVPGVLFTNS